MGDYSDLLKTLRANGVLLKADREAADAIATLTRELADARAECEGVASEAAKMLTEYLETRDAAIASAEKWEVAAAEETRRLGKALVERDAAIARAEKAERDAKGWKLLFDTEKSSSDFLDQANIDLRAIGDQKTSASE